MYWPYSTALEDLQDWLRAICFFLSTHYYPEIYWAYLTSLEDLQDWLRVSYLF